MAVVAISWPTSEKRLARPIPRVLELSQVARPFTEPSACFGISISIDQATSVALDHEPSLLADFDLRFLTGAWDAWETRLRSGVRSLRSRWLLIATFAHQAVRALRPAPRHSRANAPIGILSGVCGELLLIGRLNNLPKSICETEGGLTK